MSTPSSSTSDLEAALSSLSERERKVLAYIGEGLSMKEIAARMFRTVKTVEWYRACLGRKLGARNRVQLARIALACAPGHDRAAGAGSVRSESDVEARYRVAAASAGVIVFDLDLARNRLYISPHGVQWLGLSGDEPGPLPGHWMSVVHPDDRDALRRAGAEALAGLVGDLEQVFHVVRKDRTVARVLGRARAERTQNGKASRLIGVITPLPGQSGAAAHKAGVQVERKGLEPLTPSLQSSCSTN